MESIDLKEIKNSNLLRLLLEHCENINECVEVIPCDLRDVDIAYQMTQILNYKIKEALNENS
jgi:hypothetical protein